MLSSDESQQIGRIEAKVDILLETDGKFDTRLTILERFTNRAKGILAFLTFVGSVLAVVLMQGCSHFHVKTYAAGELTTDTVITIFGTSEATLGNIYTTEGGGVSENFKDTVKESVEAGVRAAIPGL
jgi:hypothetical protein